MKMPTVRQDFYPLGGGLDLVTPAIAIEPGKVIDSQNYEPAIGGGYSRISGYERFDGRTAPTGSSYWILPVSVTGVIALGNTITGATSAATGIVLAIVTGYLVLARVSGTFNASENLTISAVTVATSIDAIGINSASSTSLNADYALLAANDQRQFILQVPGSGRIRGVYVFNDVVYAFRDNAGGTAGDMYQSTASGWVKINFLTELRFNTAVGQINIGDVITGGTSGATATVTAALLMTGTWTVAGIGSLVLSGVTGTFASGEAIKVATVTKVTSSSASSAITRTVGGSIEFFSYNFTGSTNTKKMYGADGVNLAFEFDGTNYIPIRTGMASDTPSHVIAHKGFLFLGFLASVQYSGLGNPYAWTVVLGSGEIDTSKAVTGFLPQGGSSAGSALAIFTSERTFVLYGTSNADFKLVSSIFDIGYSAFTMQQVSNDSFGLGNRGIQALITTLNYGDFDYDSISHMIQPLMNRKRGMECASNTVRSKNQYRVYFTDGTALAVGLTGDKVSGLMVLNYNRAVRCITSQTLSNGAEVTYFGSDDGYVYMDNVGTSQDGAAIESWLRLPFNNDKSPLIRKRFRRAILEMSVDSYASVNISYDLGYGNPNVQPSAPQADTALIGAGGYWDQFTWDQFTWDAQYVSNPVLSIDGTEKNISLIFYSSRAQDQPHTISGVTLVSTPRILQR
jgi:hypothetical protein